MLIITNKRVEKISFKDLRFELLHETDKMVVYALVREDCEVEEGYSVACLIKYFIKELKNGKINEYVLDVVKELEPIIVIATPIPFPIGYIPGRFYEVIPYAIFINKNSFYTPEITLLVIRFIGAPHCAELIIDRDFGWLIFSSILLYKNLKDSDYSKLFMDCLNNILEKTNVKEVNNGVIIEQRDIHTYSRYLENLLNDLESSEESHSLILKREA